MNKTEVVFRCLSQFIKFERGEEIYKTIKQTKASMIEESYLFYSRRKCRMHF
jgi:hypothetical protein